MKLVKSYSIIDFKVLKQAFNDMLICIYGTLYEVCSNGSHHS